MFRIFALEPEAGPLNLARLPEFLPPASVDAVRGAFAAALAENAPLATISTRATLRGEMAAAVRAQTDSSSTSAARPDRYFSPYSRKTLGWVLPSTT